LRAATALGRCSDAAGEKGVQALQRAKQKDVRLSVREESTRSLERLRGACLQTLGELAGSSRADVSDASHAFARGRAARMLGLLGALSDERCVEALCTSLLADPDVYVRRRAAEAFDSLGAECGDLGAAALRRASDRDEDVYVQWTASQAMGGLGVAEAVAAVEERLDALLEEDRRRRAELGAGTRPEPAPPAEGQEAEGLEAGEVAEEAEADAEDAPAEEAAGPQSVDTPAQDPAAADA